MSAPHTTAVPELGARKPVIIFMVVDLPAPLGPRKPNTSPRRTASDTSSTATIDPKCLERWRTEIISSVAASAVMLANALPPTAFCDGRSRCLRAAPDSMRDGLVCNLKRCNVSARARQGRGSGLIRRLRLASGLVMFAYVTTHFINHSLGLVSLDLMDRSLQGIYKVWASDLGTMLLYGAFAIHYCLALWALWLRRSLKMPLAEALQLVLGFCIPFILTAHVRSEERRVGKEC